MLGATVVTIVERCRLISGDYGRVGLLQGWKSPCLADLIRVYTVTTPNCYLMHISPYCTSSPTVPALKARLPVSVVALKPTVDDLAWTRCYDMLCVGCTNTPVKLVDILHLMCHISPVHEHFIEDSTECTETNAKRSRAGSTQLDLFGKAVYSGPALPVEVPTLRELVLSGAILYTSKDPDAIMAKQIAMDIKDGRCSCGMPVVGMRCTDCWPFTSDELTHLTQLDAYTKGGLSPDVPMPEIPMAANPTMHIFPYPAPDPTNEIFMPRLQALSYLFEMFTNCRM